MQKQFDIGRCRGLLFRRVLVTTRYARLELEMSWMTPKFEEITCGMEINGYFSAE